MLKRTEPVADEATQLDVAQQAVLRVLAYRQVFQCPMSAAEVWRFLDVPGTGPAQVLRALLDLVDLGLVCAAADGQLFWLASLPDPLPQWAANRARAQAAMPSAMRMGRMLARLPFVAAVAISGSMSKGVLAEDGDFDFLIITRARRLWLAYALLALYRRTQPSFKLLCANYFLSTRSLAIERRDGFTAIELATLVPVAGSEVLSQLFDANRWVDDYLPNRLPHNFAAEPPQGAWQRRLEAMLARPVGALLDWLAWHLIHLRHRRRLPQLRQLSARYSIDLNRDTAKLHSSEWKYRILHRYQANLDHLQRQTGAIIQRHTVTGRVLVASAYYYRLDAKQWRAGQPYPPLGALYAAGVVRRHGFEAQVFDAGLAEGEKDFLHRLERLRPEFVVLHEDGFNYLTKMCLGRMRDAAIQMVSLARAFGARILVCSSDATDHPEPYLRAGATAVVRGESEATLAEILQAWRDGQPWRHIAGVAYLHEDDGTLVQSPLRPAITDLDSLPEPAWDLIDLQPYRELWLRRHGRFSLNVATTRGCPYSCNWCAKPLYGKRYTVRSPEQVVDELAMLTQRFGASHFWITDDIFGLKPGWVQRFAGLVQQRGLALRYTIQTRADLVARHEDDVRALARSGLETAWLGAESGSQRILDAMDKGITRAQIDQAVALLRQCGVRAALFLQFGYSGEAEHDIQLTCDMVSQLQPDQIGISVSYPLPGTLFHQRVQARMGSKTHWLHSHDLDPMLPGSFGPAFYRHLHTWVSRRFQLQRGWAVLCGQRPAAGRGGRLRGLASMALAVPPLLLARLGMWRAQQGRAAGTVATA